MRDMRGRLMSNTLDQDPLNDQRDPAWNDFHDKIVRHLLDDNVVKIRLWNDIMWPLEPCGSIDCAEQLLFLQGNPRWEQVLIASDCSKCAYPASQLLSPCAVRFFLHTQRYHQGLRDFLPQGYWSELCCPSLAVSDTGAHNHQHDVVSAASLEKLWTLAFAESVLGTDVDAVQLAVELGGGTGQVRLFISEIFCSYNATGLDYSHAALKSISELLFSLYSSCCHRTSSCRWLH